MGVLLRIPSFPPRIRRLLRVGIGLVWLVNGLVCKVLGMVPRHEEIVARILGDSFAGPLTRLIGLSEIGMALWVWSGLYRKVNAWLQIALVGVMNLIEFLLARDLLLWGPFNIVFALAFMMLVYLVDLGTHAEATQ